MELFIPVVFLMQIEAFLSPPHVLGLPLVTAVSPRQGLAPGGAW